MPDKTQPASTAAERTGERGEAVVIRVPTLDRLLRQLLPDDTVRHMYAAQREQLLAARSLIDAMVDRLDRMERDEPTRRKQRIEIAVE